MIADMVFTYAQIQRTQRHTGFSGLYLLITKGQITYCGRSVNVVSRLRDHQENGRKFDAAACIPCDASTLDWLERLMIKAVEPAENRAHNSIQPILQGQVAILQARIDELERERRSLLLPFEHEDRVTPKGAMPGNKAIGDFGSEDKAFATQIVLSRKQAATFIGISVRTLEKMALEGGGPSYITIGRRVLYPKRGLLLYLESRTLYATTSQISAEQSAKLIASQRELATAGS